MSARPYTSADKWVASLISGLLFLLLASPYAYALTNSAGVITTSTSENGGCPNLTGLLIHAAFFTLLIRLLMNRSSPEGDAYTSRDKWIVASVAGVLFLLLGSPFLFEVIDSVVYPITKYHLSTEGGCPHPSGLVVNALLFVVVVRILMR